MAARILVIDDEPMLLEAISVIMTDMGYEVATSGDPREGAERAVSERPDLVIVDLRMPEMNGAEVTEHVLAAWPEARVLIVTGYPQDPLAERALKAGAVGLLKKPFEIAKIMDHLEGS